MTSTHHDLDLLPRVPGMALAWRHGGLAATSSAKTHSRHHAVGQPSFTRVVVRALDWLERARQRRNLLRLDDQMLSDIGIDRSAAEAEAGKPFWRP